MGVGCPCPPVRNDTVTPRHLLNLLPLCNLPAEPRWMYLIKLGTLNFQSEEKKFESVMSFCASHSFASDTFNEFIESLCANKFAYLFLYHSRRRSTLTSCALFPSLAKACTGVTA